MPKPTEELTEEISIDSLRTAILQNFDRLTPRRFSKEQALRAKSWGVETALAAALEVAGGKIEAIDPQRVAQQSVELSILADAPSIGIIAFPTKGEAEIEARGRSWQAAVSQQLKSAQGLSTNDALQAGDEALIRQAQGWLFRKLQHGQQPTPDEALSEIKFSDQPVYIEPKRLKEATIAEVAESDPEINGLYAQVKTLRSYIERLSAEIESHHGQKTLNIPTENTDTPSDLYKKTTATLEDLQRERLVAQADLRQLNEELRKKVAQKVNAEKDARYQTSQEKSVERSVARNRYFNAYASLKEAQDFCDSISDDDADRKIPAMEQVQKKQMVLAEAKQTLDQFGKNIEVEDKKVKLTTRNEALKIPDNPSKSISETDIIEAAIQTVIAEKAKELIAVPINIIDKGIFDIPEVERKIFRSGDEWIKYYQDHGIDLPEKVCHEMLARSTKVGYAEIESVFRGCGITELKVNTVRDPEAEERRMRQALTETARAEITLPTRTVEKGIFRISLEDRAQRRTGREWIAFYEQQGVDLPAEVVAKLEDLKVPAPYDRVYDIFQTNHKYYPKVVSQEPIGEVVVSAPLDQTGETQTGHRTVVAKLRASDGTLTDCELTPLQQQKLLIRAETIQREINAAAETLLRLSETEKTTARTFDEWIVFLRQHGVELPVALIAQLTDLSKTGQKFNDQTVSEIFQAYGNYLPKIVAQEPVGELVVTALYVGKPGEGYRPENRKIIAQIKTTEGPLKNLALDATAETQLRELAEQTRTEMRQVMESPDGFLMDDNGYVYGMEKYISWDQEEIELFLSQSEAKIASGMNIATEQGNLQAQISITELNALRESRGKPAVILPFDYMTLDINLAKLTGYFEQTARYNRQHNSGIKITEPAQVIALRLSDDWSEEQMDRLDWLISQSFLAKEREGRTSIGVVRHFDDQADMIDYVDPETAEVTSGYPFREDQISINPDGTNVTLRKISHISAEELRSIARYGILPIIS